MGGRWKKDKNCGEGVANDGVETKGRAVRHVQKTVCRAFLKEKL